MEVGRGLVYPCQTMLDNVQINTSSYAMVKVDMVHDNLKDLKLEVPPDDMIVGAHKMPISCANISSECMK
jgi:hypothetical protein